MVFEWLVIAFASGIGVYFALPAEPPVWISGVLLCAVTGALYVATRTPIAKMRFTSLGIMLICLSGLGLTRAAVHTHQTEAPILRDYQTAYDMTGWIEAVERSGKGYRWRLRLHKIARTYDGAPGVAMPLRIRVRTKTAGFVPGGRRKIAGHVACTAGAGDCGRI